MNEDKILNRRQEQRMPLQGLDLKIKRTGFSNSLQPYMPCRSVDLSFNGLAFSNDTIELDVPEKIDFILTIEGHEIKGSGVTCNKRQNACGMQYGLMFLSVTPEINTVFEYDDLATAELESLAETLAEQFVYSLVEISNPIGKITLHKQQQFFDACRCYLIRLGEMGIRMADLQPDKLIHPIQAVKIFRDAEHNILLRWHNLNTGQSEQLRVAVQHDSLTSLFVVNGDHHFKTVLQVLEFLGQKLKQHIHFV